MMLIIETTGLVLVLVNLFVSCTWACKAPPGWRSWTIEEKLYSYDIVVAGTDMKHVLQGNSTEGLGPIYDGEFNVSCVFKGDNQSINEIITIKEVEPWHSCLHTVTEVGKMYIAGLKRSGSKYMWHELNLQPAAFPYTDDNLMKAQTVCGLQNPSPPTFATPKEDMTSCPKTERTLNCTGEADDTGGVGCRAAQGSIVAMCYIVVVFLSAEQL